MRRSICLSRELNRLHKKSDPVNNILDRHNDMFEFSEDIINSPENISNPFGFIFDLNFDIAGWNSIRRRSEWFLPSCRAVK